MVRLHSALVLVGLIAGAAVRGAAQQIAIGNTDLYSSQTLVSNTVWQRPLIAGVVRVQGGQTLTLQNPSLSNAVLDVSQSQVVLSLTNDWPSPRLSSALSAKIGFWIDANTNVVADESGRVSRWHDVREASLTGGSYQYLVATNSDASLQPLLKTDAQLGGKSYVDFGKWNVSDALSNTNAMWLFLSTNGVLKEVSVRAAFIVFGTHNAVQSGGTVTLIQHTTTAYFAPAFGYLWASTDNTRIDKGLNYLDRTLKNGHALFVPGASYHLVEAVALQGLPVNTLAKDRSLPGYSGGARICEAILLTAEPSDAERLQIEDYLWRKWIGVRESSLGSVRLENGAAVGFAMGTNRAETTVSGKGVVNKTGSGPLVLQNLGSRMFDGTVRLREGSVYAVGEPFRFDLEEGGQTLSVENIAVSRTNGVAADRVVKTGSGELCVASVADAVTNIQVAAGSLRLAPPRTADAVGVADGTVPAPGFEVFTNGVTAGTSFVNFTPAGTPTASTNGWRFDRSAYSTGNFLVGVAFDYNSDVIPAGSAPDGHAVLYLNCGRAETDIAIPANGFYRLSFWAAARGGGYINRYVDILLDGVTLRTIVTPSTTYWKHQIRLPFLTSGSHTLGFKAYGADYSRVAIVDTIRIEADRICGVKPIAAAATNASFELPPALMESGATVTNQPAGTGWSFAGDAGIGRIQSLDNAPRLMPVSVPDGVAAGFVNSNGCLRQTVSFPTSGLYRLSFDMATRIGFSSHAFNVLLASNLVASVTSADIGFRRVELLLPAVTNAAGLSAELSFEGLVGSGGTLFDNVQAERLGDAGLPGAVQNGDFESGDAGWTLTPRAGSVQGGTSAAWMETAPYGASVGYMITNNVLKQSVALDGATNYAVRFVTKSRSTAYEPFPLYHAFDVYYNGTRVGSVFNANGNTVRTYEFPLPSGLGSGAYDLEFRGRYANPATVSFLDQIAVVPQATVAYESVANRFPKHLVLDVSQNAALVLDYSGTVCVDAVKYAGHTVVGVISAATHSEFVSGTGSLYVAPRGTLIQVE